MANLGRQFVLLLWKNWLLQKRKACVTVFEIVLPIVFAVILVCIRLIAKNETITDPTIWPPFQPNDVFLTGVKNVILYSPNTTEIRSIMTDFRNHLPNASSLDNRTQHHWHVFGFDSEESLLEFHEKNHNKVRAGISFMDAASGLARNVEYTLRVARKEVSDRWLTKNVYPFFQLTGPRNNVSTGGDPDYQGTGFLAFQYAVDMAIVKHFNTSTLDNYDFFMKKMPYPPYTKDNLTTVIQMYLPFFLILGFILSSLQTTKAIVYEKEKKLKESMKLMGLNSSIYWASWLFKSSIYLIIASAFYSILFSIEVSDKGKVLAKTDPSLFFVFLLCYSVSIICFCFMVSTFFNKANSAAFASGIGYFCTYVPYFFLQSRYETMSKSEKLGICILNNMGMAFGINTIGIYEGTGYGAQWNNFAEPATVDDNFSLLDSMLMLLGSSAIYLIITWYVDGVFPGEYGVPLPWYFPLSKNYWCGTIQRSSTSSDTGKLDPKYFERDPNGLSVGISVNHLRKEFGSGKKKKVAVADTTLNIFKGQITALLGHNGAGKTTTMSMLTGFLPPTSGTATVNGYDICEDIQSVRRSLGLCPQHNILFDTLTVEEHLKFFAQLKGCPKENVNKEVDDMIKVLGLEAKRKNFSMTLSGGQKRKLSVGIAIIGGSEVIILDEPTSGMDPAARRQTWEILQKFREGKTMILSTHFMDEADLLGDRIAIMAEGVVKCCGTSLFLKKLYGAGYHLVMVKDKGCDVTAVTNVIKQHIPAAELESEISAELSYLLPFDQSSKFEQLFNEIEKRKSELKLTSFGTSATTMEEVFLKVGESSQRSEEEVYTPSKASMAYENGGYGSTNDIPNGVANGSVDKTKNGLVQNLKVANEETYIGFNTGLKKNSGSVLALQQFYSMFVKKVIHTWRNRTVTFVQLLVPVVFTLLALTVEKTLPKQEDESSLLLNLKPFPDNVAMYTSKSASAQSKSMADDYAESIMSEGYKVLKYDQNDFDNFIIDESQRVGQAFFKRNYIIGSVFDIESSLAGNITSYFNGDPLHSSAISLQYTMDSLLKHFTSKNHSIQTTNFPFPRPLDETSQGIGYATRGTGFIIAFCMLFGLAFLSTSFIIFLIKEKITGAKHLQKVSGVSSSAYWMSNLVWDLLNYQIPILLIMVCFAAFQTQAYTGDNRLGLVYAMFFLYGWACMPFVYIFYYLFKTPASGMVAGSLLNILTGLATIMAVFTLRLPALGISEDIGDIFDWLFTIFLPNYCLGQTLMNIYVNYEYIDTCTKLNYEFVCSLPKDLIPIKSCCRDICTENCLIFDKNYLAWETPGVGKYFVFMAAQGLFYMILVFLVEFGVISRIRYMICNRDPIAVSSEVGNSDAIPDDDDVEEEKRRINKTSIDSLLKTESLLLRNLSKSYGSYTAVKGVCVGVPQQECFGLLGQNGAGKTSTFKMLTGDEIVTGGNAYLNGYDVKTELEMVQQNLGYCPQFDALIDQMTGRETLTMYARLRGIEESQIKGVVNDLLETMMLRKYADRQCGTYSGGNKRKLSTAIALIGDPPFILLDEPTTGMDPAARRQLWNVLSQVRASGRTLILTSHSMEECDALCTKIVIMVNGRFVCLGSPQHLKNKFGHGYTLIARLAQQKDGTTAPSEPLKNFVKTTFPDSTIFDDHQGYVHFQIPDNNIALGRVFGEMERAKSQFNIEDYSVHQTTLEQVFLSFTRHQEAAAVQEEKKCCSCLCCV
ncbi:phospholipid-transporting ATPase ABCA3-like [Saccostrea cucullata]|uniref:phospholipid-transporting ATPase ABCA3-like n=1 Tax=Saccostrea cuccullata TaxID=36930 RepID=UPI002ED16FE5